MQVVLPIAYFPPVSWMAIFLYSESPLLEIHETYPKQTLRNRCNIMAANGSLRLSVPVKKPYGNKTKTSEVMIDKGSNWAVQHLRSFASAYRKTPYFEHFEGELSKMLLTDHDSLVQLNENSLKLVMRMLRADKDWRYTETFVKSEYALSQKAGFENAIAAMGLSFPNYYQAFAERFGFMPDLSVLDLIFNLGPAGSMRYLKNLATEINAKTSLYSG